MASHRLFYMHVNIILAVMLSMPLLASAQQTCANLLSQYETHAQDGQLDIKLQLKNYYGESLAKKIISEFSDLPESYQSLMFDAGIILHLGEFKHFLKNQNMHISADQMRERFSAYLGEVTVYRAMALTSEQLNAVLNEGIRSAAERFKMIQLSALQIPTQTPVRPNGKFELILQDQMAQHSSGFTRNSHLISVASYPTLAIAVAKKFRREPDQKVYLFELKVPKLKVLHNDDVFQRIKYDMKIRIDYRIVPVNSRVESYILDSISPSSIVNIREVSQLNQWMRSYDHMDAQDGWGTLILEKIFNAFNQ